MRCTFFPFEKISGEVQPLLLDTANITPFRINYVPFVNLLDYPEAASIPLNVVGNTVMFIPVGIVWPSVYKELKTHKAVIAAGMGFSLCIEILQLPFFQRVSDVDDLILNTIGFSVGYLIYLWVKKCMKKAKGAKKDISVKV